MKRSPLSRSSKPMKRKSKPTHYTKDGRLILSDADWQKMKREMWRDNAAECGAELSFMTCGICHEPIQDWDDFEPDHIIPRGLGGGTRDDRPENIQPSHRTCNRAKGSKRIPTKEKTHGN